MHSSSEPLSQRARPTSLPVVWSRGGPKKKVQQLLSAAGVEINGSRPWDITVHNEAFYPGVLRQSSLGLGEAYMDGWWDCPALDEFFCRLLSAGLENRLPFTWGLLWLYLRSNLFNRQKKPRAAGNVRSHYDLGNDLYECMLDKRMVYSCANWEQASSLDEAQEARLEFVCRKLDLQPGMKVLDIGCGWGSFAKYAAERYRAEVVGITLSPQQLQFSQQMCQGLPIELRLQDYRDVRETFDRIVSLGMFEHVGYRNYRTYMQVVRRCLRGGGLFYLGTIGTDQSTVCTDPWIEKYIFPGSMLPSLKQIAAAIEGLFIVEDFRNWRSYYDKTLMAWFTNFHNNWERLQARYGERFYRMWKYYLLTCAGTFRSRKTQVWQILLASIGAL